MRRRAERRLLLALPWLLLAPAALGAQTTDGAAYDAAPLAASIVFPDDSLPTDWPGFRTTLESISPAGLSLDRLRTLQEHLYALISADAKRRAAAREPVFPQRGDAALAQMFAWGENLGLMGAGQVAARLRGDTARAHARYPGSFSVSFDSAYTLMAEDDGWLVRFPHYFMIGMAQRQPLENGVTTTLAVLSTLFAADSSTPLGASQATIAIIAAPQNAQEMAAFWLERFDVPPFARVDPPVPHATAAYRMRAENSPFITEIVVFALPRGTVLFAYVGALGTFEANHAHFVDLMESLRVRRQ